MSPEIPQPAPVEEIAQLEPEPGIDEARARLLTVFQAPQRSFEIVVKKHARKERDRERTKERIAATLELGYKRAGNVWHDAADEAEAVLDFAYERGMRKLQALEWDIKHMQAFERIDLN